MDTFLRLASIATLVIGESWMTPAIASPITHASESTDILSPGTLVIRSTGLPRSWEPPDNGGPKSGTEGSGGR